MKIVVVGAGYVGLSLATLLAQKYKVTVLDILEKKVNLLNNRISTIQDKDIQEFLTSKELNLNATLDKNMAYVNAEYIIIATPTDYDQKVNKFNTQSIEDTINDILKTNCKATIIIKSTVPVGYTEFVKEKFGYNNIIFSPEFLREGRALHDNLYPSRIIIGDTSETAKQFGKILQNCALAKDIPTFYTSAKEAESIKLFANTYLAMRIAFFNELDSYCIANQINSKAIINGICEDARIGNYYNNPSFGYGGYCLPKDTKQLLTNYANIPQNLIQAIINANDTRKSFIARQILNFPIRKIGIYRLIMKNDSDNFKESAILDIIKILKSNQAKIIIYEPQLEESLFQGCYVTSSLERFKQDVDLILANRVDSALDDVMGKVYTRDIFFRD